MRSRPNSASLAVAPSPRRTVCIRKGNFQDSQPYSDRVILDLVGLIYAAAGDPKLWPAFLEKLGTLLRTTQNTIWLQETGPQGCSVATLGAVGTDPAFARSYREYDGARNVTCSEVVTGSSRARCI